TLHADAGAYAEAAVAFARAVEVEPRRPDWWAQALDAALLAGDTALAARLADDALLLFPGQPALIDAASLVYLQTERFADAVYTLQSLDAPTAGQLERLGDAELARDRPDAARAAWEQALALEPGRASVRTKLGQLP
ncbi:MAG: tetratricopeptide repeat protein, partial [Bacteroidota bacterium]